MRAVPLFRKPEASTGRLVVVQEGLDVLRSQREPFAIVSAVGPTRTGKSSILGRAFLRGISENVFEIGSGVTSFTGGVWITSQPILLPAADGTSIPTLLVDTEGFSGVGRLTSRTYEANLFGLVYMMSSALIFNTMFPVDASTVAAMDAHCAHAVNMLQNLKDAGVWTRRRRPRLLWTVQGFNLYNLRNSRLSAEEVLARLKNSSIGRSGKGAAELVGSSLPSSWLLEVLFDHVQLMPIRRPHASDEVVANLAAHHSSELSREYLEDADRLREAVCVGLLPAHTCFWSARPPSAVQPCRMSLWSGPKFVDALSRWLKLGHVIDLNDMEDEEVNHGNETEALEQISTANTKWLDKQCRSLNKELRVKLWHLSANSSGAVAGRARELKKMERTTRKFKESAMARVLEQSSFWQFPGKGATLVEQQALQKTVHCTDELRETSAMMEGIIQRRLLRLQSSNHKSRAESREPARDRDVAKPRSKQRGSQRNGQLAEGKRAHSARPSHKGSGAPTSSARSSQNSAGVRKSREVCFTVYD
ncbi:hypothetical protein AB1Y20_018617 [Prymnesium parvum]|uniref:Guanylate-binding protein N-terminal domain-containing protein n=1 Tax=Prymnesium parvum TaxID=97485 RepID=A0AB34JPM6_PRYPA